MDTPGPVSPPLTPWSFLLLMPVSWGGPGSRWVTPRLSDSKLQSYSGPTRPTELPSIDGLSVFQKRSIASSDHALHASNAENTHSTSRSPQRSPTGRHGGVLEPGLMGCSLSYTLAALRTVVQPWHARMAGANALSSKLLWAEQQTQHSPPEPPSLFLKRMETSVHLPPLQQN